MVSFSWLGSLLLLTIDYLPFSNDFPPGRLVKCRHERVVDPFDQLHFSFRLGYFGLNNHDFLDNLGLFERRLLFHRDIEC